MKHYKRAFERTLGERLKEKPRFIQLVSGPRQVGKTSGVLHTLKGAFPAAVYAYHESEEAIHDSNWFFAQVQRAEEDKKTIIAFDEIQKIEGWSELVKFAWDRQKRSGKLMHWILLGSSSLKLTQGSHESLAGRFERIPVHHWNYRESKEAFGLTLDAYLDYGGYPAAYSLLKDAKRLRNYLLDSVFDSVINRDILRFVTVKKPALFRQTFALVCQNPAREMSYNKFLGQLQDAGNVDQVKHYLDLYSQAYLVRLLFKFSHKSSRTSSPKLIPSAPAFTRLFFERPLSEEERGSVFEAVVGTRLSEHFESVSYWREGNLEVDYVVCPDGNPVGVEVKSKRRGTKGISEFRKAFKKARTIVIDMDNYLEFEKDPEGFLDKFAI